MLSYQEQMSNATRSQIEATMELFAGLASTTFEGVEKVVDLNMTALRTSLEDSSAAVQQLLGATDPQSFFAAGAAQAQPGAEKALSYVRGLAAISSGLSTEFARAAEARITDNQRQLISLFEQVSKNAPAGSENVMAFMKNAMGNASAGYEQFSRNAKQAVEAMESNIANVTAQATQAAAKAGKAGRRQAA
jgi:phasin family protein